METEPRKSQESSSTGYKVIEDHYRFLLNVSLTFVLLTGIECGLYEIFSLAGYVFFYIELAVAAVLLVYAIIRHHKRRPVDYVFLGLIIASLIFSIIVMHPFDVILSQMPYRSKSYSLIYPGYFRMTITYYKTDEGTNSLVATEYEHYYRFLPEGSISLGFFLYSLIQYIVKKKKHEIV